MYLGAIGLGDVDRILLAQDRDNLRSMWMR
jgi:hypothetical protein